MALFKNKNVFLLILIAALALIGWGLLRDNGFNKARNFPPLERIQKDKVDYIKLEESGTTTMLTKKDGAWEVQNGDNGSIFPASQKKVGDAIEALRTYEIADIVSQNSDKYAQFNVDDKSAVYVQFAYEGKYSLGSLYIGKSDYRRGGDYVRYGGPTAGTVIYITKAPLRSYFESPEMFKDFTLFASDAESINRIAWEYKEKSENFAILKKTEKKDGKDTAAWAFDDTENRHIKEDAVAAFTNILTTLSAEDVVSLAAGVEYGFNEPFLTLEIMKEKGNGERITFGAKAESNDVYYAQVKGREQWAYRFRGSVVMSELAKKASDFTVASAVDKK